MRAQRGVDPRLPTSALSAVSIDHIGVETWLIFGAAFRAPPLGDGPNQTRRLTSLTASAALLGSEGRLSLDGYGV